MQLLFLLSSRNDDDDDPEPPAIDPWALCSADTIAPGVVELFNESWSADCDKPGHDKGDNGKDKGHRGHGKKSGKGHHDHDDDDDHEHGHGKCGKIKETYDVAATSGRIIVACLSVDGTGGPGQSRAPKGKIRWNETYVFKNPDFRVEESVAVTEAIEENVLRVKLKLVGKHHRSTVTLRILEVDPAVCTPTTCAAQGADCDTIPDGCGSTLDCGTCTVPQFCGAGGVPNVCVTIEYADSETALYRATHSDADPTVAQSTGGYALLVAGLYDGNSSHSVTLELRGDTYFFVDHTKGVAHLSGTAFVSDLGGGPTSACC